MPLLTANPSQILPPEYSMNGYPFDQTNSPSDDGGNNNAGNEDQDNDGDLFEWFTGNRNYQPNGMEGHEP